MLPDARSKTINIIDNQLLRRDQMIVGTASRMKEFIRIAEHSQGRMRAAGFGVLKSE